MVTIFAQYSKYIISFLRNSALWFIRGEKHHYLVDGKDFVQCREKKIFTRIQPTLVFSWAQKIKNKIDTDHSWPSPTWQRIKLLLELINHLCFYWLTKYPHWGDDEWDVTNEREGQHGGEHLLSIRCATWGHDWAWHQGWLGSLESPGIDMMKRKMGEGDWNERNTM